jgi:RNA polymerase sigma factor (sigma-70 family)
MVMESAVKIKVAGPEFDGFQAKLLPFAYNILGTSMEAEDVVQEILNDYYLKNTDHIQNPSAYLTRSVINRSITEKKRLQLLKKKYMGEWLPVPINPEVGIYQHADRKHIINYALLVLLERLNPRERAVFILKETFDFAHKEVAELLETTVENSRQLYKRAQEKLEPGTRKSHTIDEHSKWTIKELTEAIAQADIEKVKQLLSAEVHLTSDGGEKVSAARKVVIGKDHVARFLQAVYGKYLMPGTVTEVTEINHCPAIIFKHDGLLYRCIIFEIDNTNSVENIFIIVNPDKLQSL